jgi:phenylpropionate dioxygenase-like ring-hydroxylating dioxygenase large terminal subunit
MQRSVPVKAAWVPIAPSHVIKKNHGKGKSPLRVYIHDSPLAVFWNDKTDTPSVIGDSCLHRGASLSIGTVDSAGCVTCKYHGKKTRGKPSDSKVVNGVIWYNDRTLDAAGTHGIDDIPNHDDFSGENRVHVYERLFEDCNPLLMQENTLDWLHLEFIHRIKAIQGLPVVTIHDENTATYAYETYNDDLSITVENRFWNWCTCLRFFFNDSLAFSLHFAWVPCGKNSTKGIVRITRSEDYTGVLGDRFLELVNELPLMEDRDIVQSISSTRCWGDDRLGFEDAFLKQFRDWFTVSYPETKDYYV